MKIYAGIGSRTTPKEMCLLITQVANMLASKGYTLRSGGAEGADTAFEKGSEKKEIFTYKHATPESMDFASKYHPAWNMCNDISRKMHGRNAMIILGRDLKTPVDLVFCWTIDENKGGTSLGIRIAKDHNIPVYNLSKIPLSEISKLIKA